MFDSIRLRWPERPGVGWPSLEGLGHGNLREREDTTVLETLTPLAPIGAALAVAAGCWKAGYYWDSKVRDPIRDKVSAKLKRAFPEGDENTASLFVSSFDRLFDPDQNGRPRFRRSVIASCIAMTVLTVVWILRLSDESHNPVAHAATMAPFMFWSNMVVYALTINAVGDFFSLWETRLIVGLMAKAPPGRQLPLLLVDVAATVLLYSISLVFGLSIGVFLGFFEALVYGNLASYFDTAFSLLGIRIYAAFKSLLAGGGLTLCDNNPGAFHGIFFYTTFFTSIWVWLFMLGIKVWPLFAWLEGTILDADKHPLGVAMTIAGIACGIVIIPVGYILLLAGLAGCG